MTGVYLQQGRMITDRDFNALCEVLKAQFENIGDKSIGTGVPRHDGLLHNFIPDQTPARAWSAEFPIKGGWVVADGVLGEARSHGYNPDIDVEDASDDVEDFTVITQRDLPQASSLFSQDREGIYYVDIWDEVVNALDDNDIMDPAFHGADSCFTTQRRVQIKKCPESAIKAIEDKITDQDFSCGYEINSEIIPLRGNCGFSIEMSDTANGTDPCNPCEGEVEIEKELGNFLFRLEVHAVDFNADGKPIKIALKWSRENGSYEIEGGTGTVFAQDYSYEMFTQDTDLEMGVPAGGFSHASGRYDHLFHGSDAADYIDSFKARRWDGFAVLDIEGNLESGFHRGVPFPLGNYKVGNSLKLTLGDLEVGLEIDGKLILTGDYWLALARSRTTEKIRALSNLPIGIKHHYCFLGYTEDGQRFTGLTPGDKRRLNFPSLSCLHADDISYKSECPHTDGATNVKEALDQMCATIPDPHHVLKMSAGTGQEAYLGHSLPGLIRVSVEDQDGRPVSNAKVQFTLIGAANGKDVIAFGSQTSNDFIVLETSATGEAQLSWSLRGQTGEHLLRAYLVSPPQNHATAIMFNALAKESSIYPLVRRITWTDGTPFKNDWAIDLDRIFKGFTIHFESDTMTELITSDALSLEMEFPNPRISDHIPFAHRIMICGYIEKIDSRKVTFYPNEDALKFILKNNNFDYARICYPDGLRFQIKLRGRFVFDKDGRPYDAFVPGKPIYDEIIEEDFDKYFDPKFWEKEYKAEDFKIVETFVPKGIIGPDPVPPFATRTATQTAPAFATARIVSAPTDSKAGYYNAGKIIRTVEDIHRPAAKPQLTLTSKKPRIALDYENRGLGHPSDLEAWFYLELDRVEDGGQEQVNDDKYRNVKSAINTMDKGLVAKMLPLNNDTLELLSGYLGSIGDEDQLAAILGYKGDTKKLGEHFDFNHGYQVPPFNDERFIIYANSDRNPDKLASTGLLNCKQIAKLLAGQSHWTSLGELYDKLDMGAKQLKRVKGRIIIDRPADPEDPAPIDEDGKKKPPSGDKDKDNKKDPDKDSHCEDHEKDKDREKDPKDDPKNDDPKEPNGDPANELIRINTVSAKDLAKAMSGPRKSQLAKSFIQEVRRAYKRKNKHGFESFEDIIDAITKSKASEALINQLNGLENRLDYGAQD